MSSRLRRSLVLITLLALLLGLSGASALAGPAADPTNTTVVAPSRHEAARWRVKLASPNFVKTAKNSGYRGGCEAVG